MLYVLAVRTGKEGTGGACTVYIDILLYCGQGIRGSVGGWFTYFRQISKGVLGT